MAGGLWIFAAVPLIAVAVWIAVSQWLYRERMKRRELRRSSQEVQLEGELQSWLRCLKAEFAADHLTIEELELEVERHMRLYNEAVRPGERRDPHSVVDEIVDSQGRATGPAQLQWARVTE